MAVQQLDEVQLGAAAGLTAAQTAAAMQECQASVPVHAFRLWSAEQPGTWLPWRLLLSIASQVTGAQHLDSTWGRWLRAGKHSDQHASRPALPSERTLLNACGLANPRAHGSCTLVELESLVACLRASRHACAAAAAAQLSGLADHLAGLASQPPRLRWHRLSPERWQEVSNI